VRAPADNTLTVGLTVQAKIDGVLCGEGKTQQINGEIVYVVDVAARDDGALNGCGAPGRTVTFTIGEETLATTADWDNNDVHALALSVDNSVDDVADFHFYLPLLANNAASAAAAEQVSQYLPLIAP
jgi:hypothetical protein